MTRLSILVCVLSFGCQAQVKSEASANTAYDAELTADAELNTPHSEPTEKTSALNSSPDYDEGQEPAQTIEPALFGARAGLHIVQGSAVTCRCLSVVVGQPNDPRLRWDGKRTTLDPNSQLIVALGSDGIDCPEASKDSLGASYHGYESIGSDVVVQVETGRMGRPLAGGAVIPKPTQGGRVLVRPTDQKSPYGRALDGKENTCVVWPAP